MHEIERALQQACAELDIPWTPFNLGRTLGTEDPKRYKYADVAHGAIVIEHEAPGRFGGRDGAWSRHAQGQAAEYATLLAREEGRTLTEYVLVAWDGASIAFGQLDPSGAQRWDALQAFDVLAAKRLLNALASDGIPLVHPRLLAALVGPESEYGRELIPRFFSALTARRRSPKTVLLFTEWKRLFGQVVGVQSEQLRALLESQGVAHEASYQTDPSAYLFALNTYIALVAKVVAALSLPAASEDLGDRRSSIDGRIATLEAGALFQQAGIVNMLNGDFFSWYRDDGRWPKFAESVESLVDRLAGVSFDTARKRPDATRDLFKGMYQSFVPRALRHALGEFYTPDWLAAHALDSAGWQPTDSLLDPTCGTGTFLLEGLKRRFEDESFHGADAARLLEGLYGIDLNPLAVLAARTSLVVYLANRIDRDGQLRLPVYLADAINPAVARDGFYKHDLQTERGIRSFEASEGLVRNPRFFEIFQRARTLIDSGASGEKTAESLIEGFGLSGLEEAERSALRRTMSVLAELHRLKWDGIWCAIVAERFAAGAISQTDFICGNPPWVKWSHLPPEYAEFIKPRCMELGVFSEDRWVGGIESDISTVITYESISKWLAPRGTLAFFITGTVFANESSQGFRRFEMEVDGRRLRLRVLRVEDFKELRPFEGVSNHPTLLLLRRDSGLRYPVPYVAWRGLNGRTPHFAGGADFRARVPKEKLLARPVPGTDAGPWLRGTREQHLLWERFFGDGEAQYRARKGVTTDLNGVFFLRAQRRRGTFVEIVNDPSLGRRRVARREGSVELEHLFPLVRGRGVRPFVAEPDQDYVILVPQRGMHGDPDLPTSAPRTFEYLRRFRTLLANRGSYRRFQKTQAYWSLWSTGKYTFSPYKVLWREMSGGRFAAAYVGQVTHPVLGQKLVIPDHKVYFVPLETENEAAYLTGILNAPSVAAAVAAYAAQLSLGVSVVEYLRIPRYRPVLSAHKKLATMSKALSRRRDPPEEEELEDLDRLVGQLFQADRST